MKPPSIRQQLAWDLQQAGHSRTEIAERLGIGIDGVSRLLTAYRRNIGMQRTYGKGTYARVTQLEGERDALAAEVARLRSELAPWESLTARLDAIEAKVDRLLARPVGPVTVTHRRVADGGVGGRRELRALREAA